MNGPQTSLKQKFLLTTLIPLFFFVGIEIFCRVASVPDRLSSSKKAVDLDMPTWVQSSDQSAYILAHAAERPDSLDWMRLFEPGVGYRIRMVPGKEQRITNTFSQVSADRSRQYLVRSNSLGFRSEEITSEKSKDTFRILIFGDSSSFGWGVDDGDTYASVMKRELERLSPGRKIEVLNFSIPGDSSEFGRLIAEKYAKSYAPDLIVIGFGANDAKKVYTPHRQQVDRFRENSEMQTLRQVAQKSAFVRSLTTIADEWSRQKSADKRQKATAVPAERYAENLDAIAKVGLSAGAKQALILTMCVPRDYRTIAAGVADEKKYLFFDGQKHLTDLIPEIKAGNVHPEYLQEMMTLYPQDLKKNDFFYISNDGCHPNKVGYRLLGEELAKRIEPILRAQTGGNQPV